MGSNHDADVIVVGAGVGGLTAAAYLAAAGKRVIVVDRQAVPGGNGIAFTHHDYEFDVGLHYVGDCEPGGTLPSMLTPLGIDITWRELDPDGFDTYVFPDEVFRVPRGVEAFRERLHRRFPQERAGIDAYLATVQAIDRAVTGDGPPDELLARADQTLGGLYDELHLSPRLRTVLAGEHGTYALGPAKVSVVLHAALVMHYLKGAYYPEGGGHVVADRLAAAVAARGGEIVLHTTVTAIETDAGRVRGVRVHAPSPVRAQGVPEVLTAPVVVSNADLKRTFGELLDPEVVPAELAARVAGYEMALPLFIAYLVLDRDLAAEGHPVTNLFTFPDDDIDGAYRTLEAGDLPERLSTYLTVASLKDPGNPRLCRPGQTNLQVMTAVPADHRFWGIGPGPAAGERYRRNPAYLARKAEVRDRMLAAAEAALPGLRDAIVYEETGSPITEERFTHASGGTSYGIAATPEQFLLHRPGPVTDIPGLYLCGASTISGHGIAGVMGGGVLAAAAVLGVPARTLLAGPVATG